MESRLPLVGPRQVRQTSPAGMLVSGILMLALAIIAFLMSAVVYNPNPLDFSSDMDNQFSTIAALMGVVLLVIGVILILLSRVMKDGEARRLEEEARAEEEERQRNIQDIAKAVKSNIKIRCRYCGSLNDESATKCDSCGAAL